MFCCIVIVEIFIIGYIMVEIFKGLKVDCVKVMLKKYMCLVIDGGVVKMVV